MNSSIIKSPYKLLAILLVIGVTAIALLNFAYLFAAPITGFASGFVYVNVTCTTTMTLTNNTIEFDRLAAGATNDTRDNVPNPFTIQNDGNVPFNVTVKATSPFSEAPNPSPFFQFACGNTTFANCTCVPGVVCTAGVEVTGYNGSQINYGNMPLASGTAELAVFNLTYETGFDIIEIDINITVPTNVSAGGKSSTVTLTATANTVGVCP
jgi:hypothetical protein